MFTNLLHLYQFVDQAMAVLHEQFHEEVKCHKGCTDCCNAAFDVSYIEARYLLSFLETLDKDTRKQLTTQAHEASKEWQVMISNQADPSVTRIRCPLLNDNGECACYRARPVNCRTYGVPTVINGEGHVCGLSGFVKGESYPTINLSPLQESLYQYSIGAGGESCGSKRWTIAEIILEPQRLLEN
ncbi:MAG: YkgJ family cysteine cluster protein [Desulfobulbaceae bacterium]|uniref:YkgJ family cysteine cluster protein n=1 Tax=Candidatus Desulfobia pelagia TaxID=2841692 RepID=A0A8J6NDU5_9BACT|nr:YkgJ family cysteine cluster protein [Candidatus Desulfobia pelagia]